MYALALAANHTLVLIHPAFTLSKPDLFSLASYFSPFASAFHPPSSLSQMLPERKLEYKLRFLFSPAEHGERGISHFYIYLDRTTFLYKLKEKKRSINLSSLMGCHVLCVKNPLLNPGNNNKAEDDLRNT